MKVKINMGKIYSKSQIPSRPCPVVILGDVCGGTYILFKLSRVGRAEVKDLGRSNPSRRGGLELLHRLEVGLKLYG